MKTKLLITLLALSLFVGYSSDYKIPEDALPDFNGNKTCENLLKKAIEYEKNRRVTLLNHTQQDIKDSGIDTAYGYTYSTLDKVSNLINQGVKQR